MKSTAAGRGAPHIFNGRVVNTQPALRRLSWVVRRMESASRTRHILARLLKWVAEAEVVRPTSSGGGITGPIGYQAAPTTAKEIED